MLNTRTAEKKEDICPNCGAPCAATDEFCPSCGRNLDELYEQLPDNWSPDAAISGVGSEPAFLVGWAAAGAGGLLAGEVLRAVLFGLLQVFFRPTSADQASLLGMLASGLSLGAALGLLQWLAIRKYLLGIRAWFLATLLGVVCAYAAEWLIDAGFQRVLPQAVIRSLGGELTLVLLLCGGAILGLVQGVVLSHILGKTWAWVLASAVGWSLAWLGLGTVAALLARLLPGATWLAYSLAYLVSGLLLGMLTAATLAWLVRQSGLRDEEPELDEADGDTPAA